MVCLFAFAIIMLIVLVLTLFYIVGPQDAAGGFLKRQLDIATLRGKATLQTAEDCFKYATENLTNTQKSSTSCRRLFRYVHNVDRKRDRYFHPIKQNRTVHQILSTEDGVLTIRNLSCYRCPNCVVGNYDHCQEACRTATRKVAVAKCEPNISDSDSEETDIPFCIRDTIVKGSLVVVFTDDPGEDYYLLKANGECVSLPRNETDSWSNEFPAHADVVHGNYYEKTGALTYKLIPNKVAIVSVNSILHVLNDIKAYSKLTISETTHEDLIGMTSDCVEM